MATVSDLIDDIRLDLWDESSTRWTDNQILRLICRAARRLNLIFHEHQIPIGLKYNDFDTVADQASYDLPSDFGAPYGLYRNDRDERLIQASMDQWYRLDNQSECTAWTVWSGTVFKIAGTPTSVISMSLRYWPTLDTSAWTTGTTIPWAGPAFDIISEYAALRAKNTDEMQIGEDLQLMQDMERKVLHFYQDQNPPIGRVEGWDTIYA